MKKFVIVFLCLAVTGITAQNVDPDEVLNKVKEKISKVNDYSVDANVKVDVEFLRVPESNAKIYFKKPDKVKMESDEFALLPRQGFNFSPAMLLQEEYTAVFAKEDTVNGNDVYLIKVLPLSDSTNIILSNLWVDKNEYIVHKIETTTKNSGTVSIELKFGEQVEYALPSELKISFKVEGMEIPSEMTGESEPSRQNRKKNNMSGTVTVKYSNYKINQGIEDDFFEQQEKKE